jgi:HD-like signal output (HDOD) protein
MNTIEGLIKKAKNIPSLPQVTSKLLTVFDDANSQAKDVGRIIESDQSLAAQVLKQANSPFYGFPGRISTLQHAIVLMGFNAIKNLAIGSSLTRMKRTGASAILGSEQFWEHSLGVGVGARAIGKEIGYPCPEELLAAGLLHDTGKLILSDSFPKEYEEVVKEADERGEEIYQPEKRVLGGSHDDVGGWFTKENRFPCVLKACVQYHHTPGSELSDEFITAVKIIHLADHLCKLEGIGWAGGAACSEATEDTCREIGLTDEARERVLDSLKAEVADTKAFFGITTTQ